MQLSGAAILFALTVLASLIAFRVPRIADAMSLRPARIFRRHEYYRLISCGFVHADWGHLIFNMLTFFFFGFSLERFIGTERFYVLYFVALLLSSLGSAFKHRLDPDYSSVGASGAILALLFASIVYFPQQSLMILPIPVPIPAPLFAIGYLAYSIYSSRLDQARPARGRINHDAHIYGAMTGLAFVAVTTPQAYLMLLERVRNLILS